MNVATVEKFTYLNCEEAILLHVELMKSFNETRCGVFNRESLKSALARPQNVAVYENADIIRQTASLYFGLVKNRIWRGGNKRTATTLIKRFLEINGFQPTWTLAEVMQLGLNVESNAWKTDEIEDWLRGRVNKMEN